MYTYIYIYWKAEDVIRKMIGEVVPPGHTKTAVFGPMHPVGVKASELLATGASPKVRRVRVCLVVCGGSNGSWSVLRLFVDPFLRSGVDLALGLSLEFGWVWVSVLRVCNAATNAFGANPIRR